MDSLRDFCFNKNRLKNHISTSKQIFNALNITPLDHVKVVILGQDPYHGPNQANGLSFSVQRGLHYHHLYVIFS